MELSGKQWHNIDTDKSTAVAIAKDSEIPLAIATILLSRGFSTKDEIERFLNPRLSNLSDPFLIHDMKPAVERIWQGIDDQETMVVYGDYDVDGVTATAVMVSVLREMGANVKWFIPNRLTDGYGLTPLAMRRCIDIHHPSLIITVDNGTGSVDAVEEARKSGVDIVVTDHHEPSGPIASASAVVNPKLGSNPEADDLAGVAVAFKVCHALLKAGREKGVECVHHIDLRNWMDLVAIGIIADIVPITGENRTLARHGLLRMSSGKSGVGVKALMDVAGISGTVNTYHVGFLIGPRINAGGRMGKADIAEELFLTEDLIKAGELAIRLDSANKERKRIENGVRADAEADIDLYFDKEKCFGLVTGGEGWHAGTIGIVASRLSSRYDRPAVVVAFDENGMGKGSCRSIEKMNILEALEECSDFLESFGGHKMAAGLVIKKSKFEEFKKCFDKACATRLQNMDIRAKQNIDIWIGLGQIDGNLFSWLEKLEPFGPSNSLPVIGSRNVRILGKPRIVGANHLKMVLTCGNSQFETIGFGLGDREIPEGPIDVLFNLQENTFRGRTTLQLNIKDFAPSV